MLHTRVFRISKVLTRHSSTQVHFTSSNSPEKLIDDCLKIRNSVQDLSDKYKGPLEKNTQKNTALPFVLLLGNHSSGKSSFVNYVCQRKIQTAGVAPTDDGFTIIMPGEGLCLDLRSIRIR